MGSTFSSTIALGVSVALLIGSVAAQTSGGTTQEGITGIPRDVTPLLSIAGVWQPIADQYINHVTPSQNSGVTANRFAGNIQLANGREGVAFVGWSFNEFGVGNSITPVTLALLEQQSDGTLQLATSKYISNPQTNGAANVLVADFNHDGIQDLFFPAHNESPLIPVSSVAYLSNSQGGYIRVEVGDSVEAHGATVGNIAGTPTVFTASYSSDPNTGWVDPASYFSDGSFNVIHSTGIGGGSSVAVGDFYGDGANSIVYGDLIWGTGLPYDPTNVPGIYLYHLNGNLPAAAPVNVGVPYFNGKPEYAQYSSYLDPYGKTHNYRLFLDDFNHDGKLDIVVAGMIWNETIGQQKNVYQMFQNGGSYGFSDVTDKLNADYDKDTDQYEYTPQVRDVDGSGINSWLLGSSTFSARTAGNYIITNDGSGRLHVGLHETLNAWSKQIRAWLKVQPSIVAGSYYVDDNAVDPIRAYVTPKRKINFVATIGVTQLQDPALPLWVSRFIFVNIPLQLELRTAFTNTLTVQNRNGSHLIRTFAGDDTIYSGNNGGYSHVDGGMGVNTVVYSGPSTNYGVSQNADGSWTVMDNVGSDGTDTLVRIQRLQFSDKTLEIGPESGWWWDPKLNGTGFFIEYGGKSGTGMFVGGFLYDASGNATWLVSTGPMSGSTYTSNWLRVTGGQTLLGPYKAPTQAPAGNLSISFTDATHAVMTRPDGTTINLVRFSFTASATPAAPVAGAPQSGWWWGGTALSGTGYGIEIQSSSVFIVAYVYDDSGNPVWYLATGSLTSPTTYAGTWDLYGGGPQLTSPEGTYAAQDRGTVSPMTLTFTDATHGTLTMGSVVIPIVRLQEF